MYIYIYIYIYVCVCVSFGLVRLTSSGGYLPLHLSSQCSYIYHHIFIYIYPYICIYLYIYIDMFIYMFVYMYIYTCIHIYQHVFIFKYICFIRPRPPHLLDRVLPPTPQPMALRISIEYLPHPYT